MCFSLWKICAAKQCRRQTLRYAFVNVPIDIPIYIYVSYICIYAPEGAPKSRANCSSYIEYLAKLQFVQLNMSICVGFVYTRISNCPTVCMSVRLSVCQLLALLTRLLDTIISLSTRSTCRCISVYVIIVQLTDFQCTILRNWPCLNYFSHF